MRGKIKRETFSVLNEIFWTRNCRMRIHVRSLAPGLTAGGSLVPFVSQLAAPRLYPGQEPCSGTAPGQPQAGSWQGNKQPLCSRKGEAQGAVAGHRPHGTGGTSGIEQRLRFLQFHHPTAERVAQLG